MTQVTFFTIHYSIFSIKTNKYNNEMMENDE